MVADQCVLPGGFAAGQIGTADLGLLFEVFRRSDRPISQGVPLTDENWNRLLQEIDLLVENRIRIDAMEQILVKTNAVAYDLYLGTVETLQTQKAAEVTRILTQTHKSRPTER
jgi:hypothetical protein